MEGLKSCLKRENRAGRKDSREESGVVASFVKNPPAKRVKSEGDGSAASLGGKGEVTVPNKLKHVVIDLVADEQVKVEEDMDAPSNFHPHKERRKCKGCKRSMSERHFSSSQWEEEVRICKHCVKHNGKSPPGEHGDRHAVGSHSHTSSRRNTEEARTSKPSGADLVTKKVKIEEDAIQSQWHDHKERRECRYCKQSMSQRHFSSSQWDKEKRTCRSCGKRREKEKSCGGEDNVPVNGGHERTMRIMLAKKAGAEAKFLCEVVPLSESWKNNDLPCEVTLEGYTRQEWGMVSDSDAREWTTVHLKCVDDKRYLQGFLDNLASRQKAAFGAFARPDGTCGVLVVPCVQPVPEGYDGKKGQILFCKYALGLDPFEREGEGRAHLHGEDMACRKGQSLPSVELKTPTVLEQRTVASPHLPIVNGDGEPNKKLGRAVEETLADGGSSSLSGMLRAQIATNEQAASAPKVQRVAMATVGVPSRGYTGPTKQTWFGWRSLGNGDKDGNVN